MFPRPARFFPRSGYPLEPARVPGGLVTRALLRVYDGVIYWVLVPAFPVVALSWSLLAGLLAPLLDERAGRAVGRGAVCAASRLSLWIYGLSGRFHVDATALDRLRDERGIVIACNHPSLIDVVLVASRLPRAVCIMKADLWRSPVVGGAARLARYIRNDSANGMVRDAARELRAGGQLLVFPEGTRTVQAPVNAFRAGFALAARAAGAPVQTVIIETDTAYLGKGWPLWRRPALPLRYRLRLGQRFEVRGDPRDFARQLEGYFAAELGRPVAAARSAEGAPSPAGARRA